MTKYVIDLPAVAKVIVAKKPFLLNETDVMRIPVSQLELYVEPTVAENVPVEKRVIELPADMIEELEAIKKDNGDDDLQGFMNDVNDDDNLWIRIGEIISSEMPTDNLLGEWWLGHVEFVVKNEPKYRYKLIGFDAVITKNVVSGLTKNVISGELFLMPGNNIENQSFTRREIEKLASEKGFKLSAFKEIEVEE